jgi:hypothetical protein
MARDRVQVALHDAMVCYVVLHLRNHPGQWFTVNELARVISLRYIQESQPTNGGTGTVRTILTELVTAGEATSRARAGDQTTTTREWAWK